MAFLGSDQSGIWATAKSPADQEDQELFTNKGQRLQASSADGGFIEFKKASELAAWMKKDIGTPKCRREPNMTLYYAAGLGKKKAPKPS